MAYVSLRTPPLGVSAHALPPGHVLQHICINYRSLSSKKEMTLLSELHIWNSDVVRGVINILLVEMLC
jgi:hypothetical protein